MVSSWDEILVEGGHGEAETEINDGIVRREYDQLCCVVCFSDHRERTNAKV